MQKLEQIEAMAKQASKDGWLLRMTKMASGWRWEWALANGIVTMTGATSAETKPVAFVYALQDLYGNQT